MKNIHLTFWDINKYSRPRKRYIIIFNTFRDSLESIDITEYDTLEKALEEAKLLNIYYQDTPKPLKERKAGSTKYYPEYVWIYPSDNHRWWGYLLLDMEKSKLIKVGGSGLYIAYLRTLGKKEFDLSYYDYFFRGDSEIPKDYDWDGPEEYEGWLRFRWGDGKNALDYQEPPKASKTKKKKEKDIVPEEVPEYQNKPATNTLGDIISTTKLLSKINEMGNIDNSSNNLV